MRVGLDVLGDPQDGLRPRSLDLILLRELLVEAVAHLEQTSQLHSELINIFGNVCLENRLSNF